MTGAKLHFEQLDIGSMKSVRAFAARVQAKFDKIHILFNNGEYGCVSEREERGSKNNNFMGFCWIFQHEILPVGSFLQYSMN